MTIALFDFDGTIYKRDSALDYAGYCLIRRPWRLVYALGLAIALSGYVAGLLPKEAVKSWWFRVMDSSQAEVESFWSKRNGHLNSDVIELLKQCQKRGIEVVVVSASPRFLLEPIITRLRVRALIATETEPARPGNLESPNCQGLEKLRRLREWAALHGVSFEDVFVALSVSDSCSDYPILAIAESPVVVTKKGLRNVIADKWKGSNA